MIQLTKLINLFMEEISQNQLKISTVSVLLKEAWKLFKERFSSILIISSVPMVLAAISLFLDFIPGGLLISPIVDLLVAIITILYYLSVIALFVGNKEIGTVEDLKRSYSDSWKLIWPYAVILFLGMVVVAGGVLMFIIPAIYAAVCISLVVFVFIAEQTKGKEAIIRSWAYIKGDWWNIFWRYIAIGLILAIIQGIVTSFLRTLIPGTPFQGELPAIYGLENTIRGALTIQSPWSTFIGTILSLVFFGPFMGSYMFSLYKSLKSVKEKIIDQNIESVRKSVKVFTVMGFIALILLILVIIGSVAFVLYSLKSNF